MRVAILDDLAQCRKEIRSSLQQYLDDHYVKEAIAIQEFESGEVFLSDFEKDRYDLLFIDQYMKQLSGIETAKHIREIDPTVIIIFVTTSREHAIDSYQVKASGYLVKPFTLEDFQQTMTLVDMDKLKNARYICIQNDKILLQEILWVDIEGHYVQLHTLKRGTLRYRLPFVQVSQMLFAYAQFLLCYKGCIVNLEHVLGKEELSFQLDNGESILFSKRDCKRIEQEYHTYLFQKAREEAFL